MKFLLTSAGFTNKTIINTFQEMVGKFFSEISLAFIPTAANVEQDDKGWLIDDMYRVKELRLKFFDVVDISALEKNMWKSRLEKVDVIMVGGGNTYHLMYWMNKSGFAEEIREWLKTKVYVGISAGSMVLSENLALTTANKLYYEDSDKIDIEKGLGFVNFHTRPHLNSEWFPMVREDILKEQAKEIKTPIYAIDDDSAVKVIDEKIEVVSEGKFIILNS